MFPGGGVPFAFKNPFPFPFPLALVVLTFRFEALRGLAEYLAGIFGIVGGVVPAPIRLVAANPPAGTFRPLCGEGTGRERGEGSGGLLD